MDEPRRGRLRPVAAVVVALAALLAGCVTASGGEPSSSPSPSSSDDGPPVLRLGPDGGGLSQWAGVPLKATGELPGGPSSAPVYATTGAVPAEAVARLARALGVRGEPRRVGGEWRVGSALWVGRAAAGSWTYGRGGAAVCAYRLGTDCAGPADPARCESATVCTERVAPVGERAAKAAVAPVLRALGYAGARIDAARTQGASRTVDVDPVLGGLPTSGWRTRLSVGPDGMITQAAGQLTEPVRGDTYPVVGAAQALRALNGARGATAARGAAPDCATPVPHASGRVQGKDGGLGEVQPCARGRKPTPLPVSGVELGLAVRPVNGSPGLVPSWLFEVPGHGTLTWPALPPRYLASDQPSPSAPSPSPTARRAVTLTSYTAKGSSVTVHFSGSVCSRYTASATETPSEVRILVTGTEKNPGAMCVMIAKEFTSTVNLTEPLGTRALLDASTQKQVAPQ
ncbi:hypothetical protein [Streptomyces smaragdinus]|uniref:hypothetical protein n=1 Tax=Streptomyces smaragdinus TaxID=2585196 RepID=UPI001297D145|nr:hypothetical protein [Streptomyces smaragdinus]